MLITPSTNNKITLLLLLLLTSHHVIVGSISSYSRNDTYPIYTSLDPHTFLNTRERLRLQDYILDTDWNEWFGFSISPFAQNANRTTIPQTAFPGDVTPVTPFCQSDLVEETCLGNINGRWSMIGLLFGNTPGCCPLPSVLQTAKDCLFPDFIGKGPLTDPLFIDKMEKIGFFDVSMKYRKRGVRFDFKGQLSHDFGVSFNTGLADICQTISFENRGATTGAVSPQNINGCRTVDTCTLNETLMNNLKNVAAEICLDITKFHKFSIEDLRGGIYWRHPYAINLNRDSWESFLLIPFVHIEASIPLGKKRDFHQFAALSFGNNDHFALGGSTGLNILFFETIEIGAEFGYTHFFSRDVCRYPMPTSCFQSGIYPFCTSVNIQPGDNWHFGLKMNAYHFLGDLSFYFQYILVEHQEDHIRLKVCDPAFVPHKLELLSNWKSQLANIGFNYDISPNISLGFLWQTPLPSIRTYRTTTVMLSFNAVY
ncbi:MAG TPA: hypothetical protein VGT41_02275 [Candidatus Babeliales bacterium]|nr:hypothetical protein [Candidatus Babeliales bacterium]